jgi:epsilon-lactone hydrolase
MALIDMKNQNQGMLNLIKKVHSLVESKDLEKQRQSKDNVGLLFGKQKEILFKDVQICDMHGEWVSVNKAHMKKHVILYCHGGGYMTGSTLYARTITTKLATTTSMDVLCFDYRLAPENPYPAALEDALKAWDYLMHQGFGARDIIVVGDSAGGNLAISLTLKLREQNRLHPRALVLMSPWTDMTLSGKSHETKAEVDPILNADYMQESVGGYATGFDLSDPFISPLFADFSNFPPTYIQVGDNEILYSDSLLLYKKMIKDQVNCKIDVYKGMWHVFQMSPFKTAVEAMDSIAAFIFRMIES